MASVASGLPSTLLTCWPGATCTFQGGGGRSGAKRVALIREWRDVMAEVGDHQSLVASLRQSTYYNLFKDEVSALFPTAGCSDSLQA